MGYTEGKENYKEGFIAGICGPLVEQGEFESMEECKKAAEDETSDQAANWADEAPAAMAAYLKTE